MKRLMKYVPAATDTNATIEVLLKTGFSTVVRAEELQERHMGQPSKFCTGGC
jgi:hypothetical protein